MFVTTNLGVDAWNAIPSGSLVIGTCWTRFPLRSRMVRRVLGVRFERKTKFPSGDQATPSTKLPVVTVENVEAAVRLSFTL